MKKWLTVTSMLSSSKSYAIHQFLPALWFGDAISNHAIAIRDLLREEGYASEIYAEFIHPSLKRDAHIYTTYTPLKGDVIIYHLSIGSPVAQFVRELSDKIILIYHNITPSAYLARYNDHAGRMARLGRQEIRMLLPNTVLALGDSQYNVDELRRYGYENTAVLPIIRDMRPLTRKPSKRILKKYGDDRTTVMFLGRISPNKRQDNVIRTFALYKKIYNPTARLLIAGSAGGMEQYKEYLDDLVLSLGVDDVEFLGVLSREEVGACYLATDIFFSMSEHEGFMVPLIESMYFGVPIVAYNSSAISDTLGTAGVLLPTKSIETAAAALHVVATDEQIRNVMIKAGRKRYEKKFNQEKIKEMVLEYINNATEQ